MASQPQELKETEGGGSAPTLVWTSGLLSQREGISVVLSPRVWYL